MDEVVWLKVDEDRWLGVTEHIEGEWEAEREGATVHLRFRPASATP